MLRYLSLSIILLLLFSCTPKEITKEQVEEQLAEQKQKKKEILKGKETVRLVSKYDIQYMWDTLSHSLSINYEPALKSEFQLIGNCVVHDIYEVDSIRYASLEVTSRNEDFGRRSFYFDFPISKVQEEQLLDYDYSYDYDYYPFSDILLVVSIERLRKIKLELDAEIQDEESAMIEYSTSGDFFGNGKIVEIILIK